jgi:biotin carboxylase
VKPLMLSGSRGVMRADAADAFVDRFERLGRLLGQKDVRSMREVENERILIEGFVPGAEFAVEGLLEHGRFQTLAIFDKPDPLDGPFFEETIYVTPSRQPRARQLAIMESIARAATAMGLYHGPIHAECRVADDVVVLEVAARPIGGLCARILEFTEQAGSRLGLEELLLRHAAGDAAASFQPVSEAAGVMMIPIPGRGVYRGVEGIDEGLAVPGVAEIQITAKPEQTLVPLPEGASYLGFVFAKAKTPALAEEALRRAHGRLRFRIDPALVLAE